MRGMALTVSLSSTFEAPRGTYPALSERLFVWLGEPRYSNSIGSHGSPWCRWPSLAFLAVRGWLDVVQMGFEQQKLLLLVG